ncbi:MAG: PAS domain S-box protein [Chitinispirillaceae bacterium]|nr:PAS domain S-box protein [Chitinispirillaceae bacterium]
MLKTQEKTREQLLKDKDDITESKNGENKLKQSEERYKAQFEHALDAIVIGDAETGIMIDCNESALTLFGRTRSEIVGQHQRILHPPEEIKDGFSKSFKQHTKEKEGQIIEEKIITKDGQIRDVIILASLVKSGGRKLLCGTFRDVTERKRLDEALRESEERYRTLFEQAPFGIGIISLDGKVLKGNPALESISGYTIDELHNINISDIYLDPEERARVIAAVKKHGRIIARQARFKRKDGTEYYASITTKIISIAGMNVLHTMVQDISEHIKIEMELQRAQKLESLGLLAGGIAHDFNNLLGGLFGSIDLARMNIRNDIEARRHLDRAMQCLSLARDLTHQLLTFAKGGLPEKKPVPVQFIIKQSAEIAISGTTIRQQYSLPPDALMVEVDEGQLHQVFTNVFINSRQAMPNGGTIQVAAYTRELREREIDDLTEGSYVFVTIRDDGPGIAPDYLPKVFDPFFTTKQTGSGLGLAASYSIIKKHGGHILIESELGKCTLVTIVLPASTGEPIEEKMNPAESIPLSGRILVMDDQEVIRKVAKTMIESLGTIEVECAATGEKAIELYGRSLREGRKFDVVILDLTVADGMGGEKTIRSLLEIDPHVKAIVSSGYSDSPILAHHMEYGFLGKIAKPYQRDDLLKVISEVMNT